MEIKNIGNNITPPTAKGGEVRKAVKGRIMIDVVV